ncbi:MAG: radical SAM family heme chaperone HemW [Clostridiales bacterium]|nr:radical SAM family heme chaperone HemW [Clostridiales bacterium]
MSIGLYIHIPFCKGKCPYCDFYSVRTDEELMNRYVASLVAEIGDWADELFNKEVSTIYIGGGSPSQIGGIRLRRIINAAKDNFNFVGNEITVELNPSDDMDEILPELAKAGVTRISLGMQSAVDEERKALGRRASADDVKRAIEKAKDNSITNISLDLMIGVPKQSLESLEQSLDFLKSADITHISFYMLSIEEGTHFYDISDKLVLPEEEDVCQMYEKTIEELEKSGFKQYEISNLAKEGFESQHNLKYWHCEEYLGIGPSAHSFLDGKRFYYPRDIELFINGTKPINDGNGGDFEEYAMLALRLTEGLQNERVIERFGKAIDKKIFNRAKKKKFKGLLKVNDNSIALTPKGFLVSNSIISELIEE